MRPWSLGNVQKGKGGEKVESQIPQWKDQSLEPLSLEYITYVGMAHFAAPSVGTHIMMDTASRVWESILHLTSRGNVSGSQGR